MRLRLVQQLVLVLVLVLVLAVAGCLEPAFPSSLLASKHHAQVEGEEQGEQEEERKGARR